MEGGTSTSIRREPVDEDHGKSCSGEGDSVDTVGRFIDVMLDGEAG